MSEYKDWLVAEYGPNYATVLSFSEQDAGQAAWDAQARRIAELEALLARSLPIIVADARMMADISRFSPLDAGSQAVHDNTEYESEKLVREIPAALRTEIEALR